MASNSFKLEYEHISAKIDSTIQFIKDRHEGKLTSLKTGLKKLDEALLSGLD